MAKQKASTYMSNGELIAGVIFFVIYLLVLPFAVDPAFDLIAKLLGTGISDALRSAVYYYVMFAVTLVIFHNFLSRTSRQAMDRLGEVCKNILLGMVAMYGLNELVYRLTNLVMTNRTNLNDTTIFAQIEDVPRTTLLIIIFVAPFVEEVLFRGLVFGNLKSKYRVAAYIVSCLLFAALHVWQFAVVNRDMTYFLLMVQYLVPGLVLAWVYERSGTLWTSIGLHMAVNAMAVWGLS
ncbi:MAG: CPBP family intramembrane metalloprotease [Oscillospiraceae bacterium]|nr:CPBP family intramembrane metalloprotease [Oscillospiraceae bacterium]